MVEIEIDIFFKSPTYLGTFDTVKNKTKSQLPCHSTEELMKGDKTGGIKAETRR